jgi:hypothetical protein
VQFSYQDDCIEDIKITLKKEERTLIQLMFQVKFQTNLYFEIVEQRYVVVNKSQELTDIEILDSVILTSYPTKGISLKGSLKIKMDSIKYVLLVWWFYLDSQSQMF